MAVMLFVAAGIYLLLGERRDAVVMIVALVSVIGIDVFLDGREITIETADLVRRRSCPGQSGTGSSGAPRPSPYRR